MWPAYHLNRLALNAVGVPADRPLTHGLVLGLFFLACSALAVRRLARVG